MMNGHIERIGQRWRDILCALAIVAMVAHNHYNVRATRDVGADDEAWYVASGVLFGKPGFPNGPDGWPIPEQGALHCLSYFGLSKLHEAPLELYYASWQLRTTLIALAIFVLVRRARCPWWQALVASFAFVNCAIADVWPFPVHTAALVVLFGLVGASFARTTTAVLGIATATLAFAGFCRPELLYAYGVAVTVFVIHLIREATRDAGTRPTRRWGTTIAWIVAAIAPGAALGMLLGNPLGGTRAYFAFAQHYTLALFEKQGNPLDPWANWGPTVARDFPGASTVFQALRANPTAFFEHVMRNVSRLPENTMRATRPLLDVSKFVEHLLWAGAIGISIVQGVRIVRARTTNPTRTALTFAFFCGLVPFVLAVLIVHPRLHYYVLVIIVGMTLVASHPLPPLPRVVAVPKGARMAAVFVTCLLAVALTATKSEAASFVEWVTRRPRKHELFGDRQRVSTRLRELNLQRRVVTLEYAWGTCFYAGYECESYLRWDKLLPFDRFVAQKNIDLVILDEGILKDVRFIDDDEFADFLVHPERHGFVLDRVPGTTVRIGIRIDRMSSAAR